MTSNSSANHGAWAPVRGVKRHRVGNLVFPVRREAQSAEGDCYDVLFDREHVPIVRLPTIKNLATPERRDSVGEASASCQLAEDEPVVPEMELVVHNGNGLNDVVPGGGIPELTVSRSELRHRPRSKVTRTLEALGGSFEGWWEDLAGETPAARGLRWLTAHLGSGVKGAAIKSLRLATDLKGLDGLDELGGSGCAGGPVHVAEIPCGGKGSATRLHCCVELVAHLAVVACFRPPSPALLSSLRARARLWAREVGVSDLDLSLFLPGTLVLAMRPSSEVVMATHVLRSDALRWGADVLGAFDQGVVREQRFLGFWEGFRRAFRFSPSPGTLHATVDSMQLSK